jgi:serine/threonine protein kinase
MFGLFGSKKPASKPAAAPVAAPKAAPPVKLKTVNIAKRFTIISETGQGSMSKVYKALDNGTGRVVCLKVQDMAKTTAAIGRAAMEGRPSEGEIGTRIKHRNVVQTHEFGRSTKGEHWLTMEFVEGASLSNVRESSARDIAKRVNHLIQVADGLEAVHRAGFIHRDVGPKNVLVTGENVVKIIDFGLAVPNTPLFRRPGNRTGTLNYMAPELLRREATDERIDIFSYGVLAFEFFTNRIPFDLKGDQMTVLRMRMNADPMELAKVAPDLPPELCAVIQKAMARRKEERWKSMAEISEALRGLGIAADD